VEQRKETDRAEERDRQSRSRIQKEEQKETFGKEYEDDRKKQET
jgi:hypothetical protein